jgi:hypothetical protein
LGDGVEQVGVDPERNVGLRVAELPRHVDDVGAMRDEQRHLVAVGTRRGAQTG